MSLLFTRLPLPRRPARRGRRRASRMGLAGRATGRCLRLRRDTTTRRKGQVQSYVTAAHPPHPEAHSYTQCSVWQWPFSFRLGHRGSDAAFSLPAGSDLHLHSRSGPRNAAGEGQGYRGASRSDRWARAGLGRVGLSSNATLQCLDWIRRGEPNGAGAGAVAGAGVGAVAVLAENSQP